MHGFILAAGFGKRMGAYTDNCPKPLLEIDGIKLLDYSLYLLEKWKIEKKIINTHYLSERIEEYFSNFTLVEIQISREKEILGTGGGIYTALQKFWSDLGLLEKFLVINPDTILFPSDEFHPDFPILFPDSLSHLYLKPIEDGKSYTTLFLKEGRVFFHNVELSIPCYYIGLSLFKLKAFTNRNYQANMNFELGSLWRQLSDEGLLTGEFYNGDAIDIGEKEFYEKLKEQTDFFRGRKSDIFSKLNSLKKIINNS